MHFFILSLLTLSLIMDLRKLIKDITSKMQKALEHFLHELSTLHTGKASPAMVENILVDVYGTGAMRLKEICAITVPDAHMIVLQPWDKAAIKPIEKALHEAKLGFSPRVNGNVVQCPTPPLSGDRRKEIVKSAQRLAEESRISIRNARTEGKKKSEEAKKAGLVGEDDCRRTEKTLQELTDQFVAEIDSHLKHKEKELLTV
jgi:ribosome recycling factor